MHADSTWSVRWRSGLPLGNFMPVQDLTCTNMLMILWPMRRDAHNLVHTWIILGMSELRKAQTLSATSMYSREHVVSK